LKNFIPKYKKFLFFPLHFAGISSFSSLPLRERIKVRGAVKIFPSLSTLRERVRVRGAFILFSFLLFHATSYTQTEFEILKKQEEIKALSLFNRIINAIDVRLHAGFGAGYFLSQYDPINPIYQPYAVRDRFSLSVSLNLTKILDNSNLKIKQIELKALEERKRREDNQKELKRRKLEEQLNLLNEQLKTQSQIVEINELYFNQNKISLEKLLEEKMKLLQLKTQIKQIELELNNLN
jgi:hypothetical protein